MKEPQTENVSIQKWVFIIALILFGIKLTAYYLTRSVAVLTDALESIVNVIAGAIGLYSLYLAAKPKDQNHPYGHGKAEFLSAAIEGTLIIIAGFIIIYESILNLVSPKPLQQLDKGIILISITALVNYVVGFISTRKGKKNNSLALVASGQHLKTDAYSTVALIIGLVLILFTGYVWLDGTVAILFAVFIIYTGYRIMRSSIAGIMDEADKELLTKMVRILNSKRRDNWIDLHNLRVIKYGGQLHVDCHLTVPWYLNVVEAHHEVDILRELIRKEFGTTLELFVHTDPCLDFSCSICTRHDCQVRQRPFEEKFAWTLENIISDKKHQL
ncbi:MAG TPA: cation diffusion facilitator family transporter [Flavitalea sp.]|nr:cation diffusion facilitator family transporter [Flavitalea sp.]